MIALKTIAWEILSFHTGSYIKYASPRQIADAVFRADHALFGPRISGKPEKHKRECEDLIISMILEVRRMRESHNDCT